MVEEVKGGDLAVAVAVTGLETVGGRVVVAEEQEVVVALVAVTD